MKRNITALAAAAALVLAGCGQTAAELDEPTAAAPAETTEEATTEETSEPAETTTEEPAETTTDEPEETTEEPTADEPEETTEEKPANEYDGIATFGESYTYQDGLAVTISEPEPFTPGEWSFGGENNASHLTFTITVENGSDEPMDLSMAMTTVQSGTTEGDEVYDSENGLDGSPSTTLLPGRTSEWVVGFGVDDPSDLVVQFAPSWDHENVHFVTE